MTFPIAIISEQRFGDVRSPLIHEILLKRTDNGYPS